MGQPPPPTATPTNPRWQHWRIRINAILWFLLILGFGLSVPLILDWAAWVLLLLAGCAVILAVPAAWLRRRLFAADRARSWWVRWRRSAIALLFLLCLLAASPIYYLAIVAELRPPLMPQVELSDGSKRVVFQGMMHIGSGSFYKAVIYDIEKAIASGYTLYYEGVQTATPESKAFFAQLTNALTGSGGDLGSFYRLVSEACGLQFQSDYFTLLDADKREHPQRHVIADVDALEMKREYERLMQSDAAFAAAHPGGLKPAADSADDAAIEQAIEWLGSGTASQKKLAGVICRGLIALKLAPQERPHGPYDALVLDFRNRALATRILDGPHAKIFITYGAHHLPGLLALLQQRDPRWQVESVKWLRTMEAPKHFEGTLQLQPPG